MQLGIQQLDLDKKCNSFIKNNNKCLINRVLMFNAISTIISFFHCKTKGIDGSADCDNHDIYLYSFYKHEERLFQPICCGISWSLADIFCFSCLPTKCKTKCNTPFTVSRMMHQTSRFSCTPRTTYFAIVLDETQLWIKT